MESWQFTFFFATLAFMLVRVIYDNWVIAKNYNRMSTDMSAAVGVTDDTKRAFNGFYKWGARTHYFIILFAMSEFVQWIVNPTFFMAYLLLVEFLLMMFIHFPQRVFTKIVLDRFFDVDIAKLEGL